MTLKMRLLQTGPSANRHGKERISDPQTDQEELPKQGEGTGKEKEGCAQALGPKAEASDLRSGSPPSPNGTTYS